MIGEIEEKLYREVDTGDRDRCRAEGLVIIKLDSSRFPISSFLSLSLCYRSLEFRFSSIADLRFFFFFLFQETLFSFSKD